MKTYLVRPEIYHQAQTVLATAYVWETGTESFVCHALERVKATQDEIDFFINMLLPGTGIKKFHAGSTMIFGSCTFQDHQENRFDALSLAHEVAKTGDVLDLEVFNKIRGTTEYICQALENALDINYGYHKKRTPEQLFLTWAFFPKTKSDRETMKLNYTYWNGFDQKDAHRTFLFGWFGNTCIRENVEARKIASELLYQLAKDMTEEGFKLVRV